MKLNRFYLNLLWPILLMQIKGCGLLICVKRWKGYLRLTWNENYVLHAYFRC